MKATRRMAREAPGWITAEPRSDLPSDWLADIGVLALALGTAFGFTRLFQGWGFLEPLGILTILSWATAVLLRRIGARPSLLTAAHLVIGVVVLGIVFLPSSTLLGIPTPATLSTAWSEVADAFVNVRVMVPPVKASTGFLITAGAGMWVMVLYGDMAARLVSAVVQAAVPFVVAFISVGIPSGSSGRIVSIAGFLAGLTVYVSTTQLDSSWKETWVGGARARFTASSRLAVGAASIMAVAALAGLVAAVVLPEQTRHVDLRQIGRGPSEKTVVSPFVSISSLLGQRSDTEMFRVKADHPSYWRLTSLDTFDPERDIWVSHSTYSNVGSDLSQRTDVHLPGEMLKQEYRISNLTGVWIPAAYKPWRVSGQAKMTYNRESTSLITDRKKLAGLQYSITSFLPDFSGLAELPPSGEPDPGSGQVTTAGAPIDPDLLKVGQLPLQIQRLIDDVTGDTRNPYRKMVALQDWFRSSFRYDETVDFSDTNDPLTRFIAVRRGFCQQFSSAFAQFARYLGIPSRVAVGFTQGDPSVTKGSAGGSNQTEFVVKGRHAHAWPEVYLKGFGWVPFEPTPGRGNPATTAFTGIPGAQAAVPETTVPVETSTTTTAPAKAGDPTVPTSAPTTTTLPKVSNPGERSSDSTGANGDGLRWVVSGLVVLALVGGWLFMLRRRRLRTPLTGSSTGGAGPESRVGRAWESCVKAMATVGVVMSLSETPVEFARRAPADLARVVDRSSPVSVANGRVDTDSGLTADGSAGGQDLSPVGQVSLQQIAIDLAELAEEETFRRFGADLDDSSGTNESELSREAGDAAEDAADRISAQIELIRSRLSEGLSPDPHHVRRR